MTTTNAVCGAETAGFKPTGFEPQPRQKTAHWLKGGEGEKALLLLLTPLTTKHEVKTASQKRMSPWFVRPNSRLSRTPKQ